MTAKNSRKRKAGREANPAQRAAASVHIVACALSHALGRRGGNLTLSLLELSQSETKYRAVYDQIARILYEVVHPPAHLYPPEGGCLRTIRLQVDDQKEREFFLVGVELGDSADPILSEWARANELDFEPRATQAFKSAFFTQDKPQKYWYVYVRCGPPAR